MAVSFVRDCIQNCSLSRCMKASCGAPSENFEGPARSPGLFFLPGPIFWPGPNILLRPIFLPGLFFLKASCSAPIGNF